MRSMILAALSIFLVQACGSDRESGIKAPGIIRPSDPYFDKYLTHLEGYLSKAKSETYKIKTAVVFVDSLPNSVLARCWRNRVDARYSYIEVDRTKFERAKEFDEFNTISDEEFSPSEKWLMAILLHEVGHCDFYLDHDNHAITRSSSKEKITKEDVPLMTFKVGRWGYQWNVLRRSIMWPTIGSRENLYPLLQDYANAFFNKYPADVDRVIDYTSKVDQIYISSMKFYQVYEDNRLILETDNPQKFYSEIFELPTIQSSLTSVDNENDIVYICNEQ